MRQKGMSGLIIVAIFLCLAGAAGAEAQPAADGLCLPQKITTGTAEVIVADKPPESVGVNGRPLTMPAVINGRYVYFFALPVDYTKDSAVITVKTGEGTMERTVAVTPHENTVRDVSSIVLGEAQSRIRTDQDNQVRIASENKLVAAALAARSPQQFAPPFAYPLPEPVITSVFGKKRNYYDANHKFLYCSYHLGLDMRAQKGAPIYCTAAGTVVLAAETLVRGNAVYVDHGLGIISVYMHMDFLSVKTGDRVKQGTVLGGAGTTGLSTGVHLHWSVVIDGVNVDGASMVEVGMKIDNALKELVDGK